MTPLIVASVMYFTLPRRTCVSNKLSSKEIRQTIKNNKEVWKCLNGVCSSICV